MNPAKLKLAFFVSRTSLQFLLRARHNEKEFRVKPATPFNYFQYLLTKSLKQCSEKILFNSTLVPQDISQNKSLRKSLIPQYEFYKHRVYVQNEQKSQSNPIYNTQLISGESSQRYPYANLFPLYTIKDPSRSFWTLLEIEPTSTYSYIPALIKNIPNLL